MILAVICTELYRINNVTALNLFNWIGAPWSENKKVQIKFLLSCLTSVSAFIENSSYAWKYFTPVLISYFITVPSGWKGSVRFVDGVGRGRVEPGGAEGTTTANEASVGQSIPRPRRVSIRCFFFFISWSGHRGVLQNTAPKKNQSLHWCCCQSCAPQNHDTGQQFDSDCALTVCSVWTRLLLWIDLFQLDSWNLARHFVLLLKLPFSESLHA